MFDSPSLLSLLCLPFHPKKHKVLCVFISFISKATNPRIHLFLPTLRGIRQSRVSQEVLAAPLSLWLHKYPVNLASPGDQHQTLLKSKPNMISWKQHSCTTLYLQEDQGYQVDPEGQNTGQHESTGHRSGMGHKGDWVPVVQVGL